MHDAPYNLDRLAAQYAQEVIKIARAEGISQDIENSIIKSLGVLQGDGVYACLLFLEGKEEKKGELIVSKMIDLLEDLNFEGSKPVSKRTEDVLSYITNQVTINLDQLILAKDILERMLIYARYGAKACS